MGAADYEALIEELDVLRDITLSERELTEGKEMAHEDVKKEVLGIVRGHVAE
jgi:hypothetical protein